LIECSWYDLAVGEGFAEELGFEGEAEEGEIDLLGVVIGVAVFDAVDGDGAEVVGELEGEGGAAGEAEVAEDFGLFLGGVFGGIRWCWFLVHVFSILV